MKRKETIKLTPNWSGILPALLAILQNDEGTHESKAIALSELKRMAQVADLYVSHKEPKRRDLPSKRDRIISVLQDVGKPLLVSEVSKATQIPGTSFASIMRDERNSQKNKKGRLHVVSYEKNGETFLSLSSEKT